MKYKAWEDVYGVELKRVLRQIKLPSGSFCLMDDSSLVLEIGAISYRNHFVNGGSFELG